MGKLRCRIFGHRWRFTASLGEWREEMCSCEERRVWDGERLMGKEEGEAATDKIWYYAQGIMYLLDNVEPDYSAGRDS